ncbi:Carboxylesterase [Chaetomium fimeti]|uniref:Carboxylic ester hydrolase n=1 Tax=Chaetomium fimeti TaxID=1854472 RepID=A0AAE0H8C0_9PEZI|nr:Carboxylesterase [Chaetomium fimeti]
MRSLRLFWALIPLLSTAAARLPTVTLKDAVYVGTTTHVASATATVDKFLGIPYATTPERFRAARPRPPGSLFVNATEQPPACIQQSSSESSPESEDCLFLNVFAPHLGCGKPKAEKAVMLWFYGGALSFGSITDVDGSSFAANQDIILVACNYRLGVFGFPGNVSGLSPDELNPGFRDQKMAMRWIQENISRFGGDPTKVTIFGESAGAVSADSHLISELSDHPPFRAAILQSGGLHTFNRVALGVGVSVTGMGTGNKAGEAPFLTLAKYLNCSEENAVPCLQSKPMALVKSAVLTLNLLFSPVDDGGKTSVADTDSARRAGRTARVPVLVGSTFMEGNIFSDKTLQQKTLEGWADVIYPNNPTAAAAVVNAYSVGSSWQAQTPDDAVRLLHSDFHFACTTTYDSNIMATIDIPTWRYLFNASLPSGLASHGSEISFVFGDPQSTPANQELSAKIQGAWADFAKDPSSGPGWTKYSPTTPSLGDLGGEGDRASITVIDPAVVDSRCSVFWDAYDPSRPR